MLLKQQQQRHAFTTQKRKKMPPSKKIPLEGVGKFLTNIILFFVLGRYSKNFFIIFLSEENVEKVIIYYLFDSENIKRNLIRKT